MHTIFTGGRPPCLCTDVSSSPALDQRMYIQVCTYHIVVVYQNKIEGMVTHVAGGHNLEK